MLPMFTMLAMLAMLPMLTMLTSKNKRNCTLQGGWVGVDNGIESVLEADCLTGACLCIDDDGSLSCLAQNAPGFQMPLCVTDDAAHRVMGVLVVTACGFHLK